LGSCAPLPGARVRATGQLNLCKFRPRTCTKSASQLSYPFDMASSLQTPPPPIHPPTFNFVEVIKRGYRDWGKYSARSSRREFWLWFLHIFLISLVLNLIGPVSEDGATLIGVLLLPTVVASLSMWVRRIHDTGHRVWWCLIPFVSIVLLCSPTNPRETRWARTTNS